MRKKTPPAAPSPVADPPLDDDDLITIGELAAASGLTTRAIRFYEARGLISPPRRGVARAYSRRERARLQLIKRGKNLGFTIDEIGQWLALYDSDPSQVMQARVLIEKIDLAIDNLSRKRADIDRSLKDMRDIRALAVNHLRATGHL